MSKEQKYGPNVGLRLPLEAYDLIRGLSEAEGKPISVLCREMVMASPRMGATRRWGESRNREMEGAGATEEQKAAWRAADARRLGENVDAEWDSEGESVPNPRADTREEPETAEIGHTERDSGESEALEVRTWADEVVYPADRGNPAVLGTERRQKVADAAKAERIAVLRGRMQTIDP